MSHPAFRRASQGLAALGLLLATGCAGTSLRWWPPAFFPALASAAAAPPPAEWKTAPVGQAKAEPSPRGPDGQGPEGDGPVVPASYNTNSTAVPPPVATRPTVTGTPLNLAPGETPAERAVELARRLATAEEEKLALAAHAQQLAVQLENKDRALLVAEKEVRAAAEDVAKAREDLQRWKRDMGTLRDRLRSAEQENVATLRSIITWLERALGTDRMPEKPPEQPRGPDGAEPARPQGPGREQGP